MPRQAKKIKQVELADAINERLPEVRVSPRRNSRGEVDFYEVFLMATTETGAYSIIGLAVKGEFKTEEEALAAWQYARRKEFVHKHLWKGQAEYINREGLNRY